MSVQRDYGDRVERARARFKYTIDDKGLAFIKSEIEARMGLAFEAARPFAFTSNGDPFGWRENGAGRFDYALFIQNGRVSRSEEHTSELQSLMRISYAVFCLKKKKYSQHLYRTISSTEK